MAVQLTPTEQVRRFLQFCVWLRLDVRYEGAPRTKGFAGLAPVDALRRVLEWSQRQVYNDHKESKFQELGSALLASKATVEDLIGWVHDAKPSPEFGRPIDLDGSPEQRRVLVRDWQAYLLGVHEQVVPVSVRKILPALAALRSPLRDFTEGTEGAVAVEPGTSEDAAPPTPELVMPAPDAATSPHAPATPAPDAATPPREAATPAPRPPSAQSAAPGPARRRLSSPVLALGGLVLLVIGAVALSRVGGAERSIGQVDATPNDAAPIDAVAAPPSAANAAQRAGTTPPSGAPADHAGAVHEQAGPLQLSLITEVAGKPVEVGPEVPLPSRTRFYFRLQTDRPLYVVLCEFAADGALRPLFPTLAHDRRESWPLQPHRVQEIPPPHTGALRLDDEPGRERLLIVASSVPLGDDGLPLARALAQVTWRPDWTPIPSFARGPNRPASTLAVRPLRRGVDVVYSDSPGTSAEDALVVARFVTIDHTPR